MIPKPKLDEAEVVRLAISKSVLAAEVLYDQYADVLLLAIFRIVRQKAPAEVILQQAFVEIWNSFDQYLQQKEKLLTWMLQIVRRIARDAVKSDVVAVSA